MRFLFISIAVFFILISVSVETSGQTPADETVMADSVSAAGEDAVSDSLIGKRSTPKISIPKPTFAYSDSAWWYRKIDNVSFGLGEYLEFSVKYGMLPAGTAILKISEIIDFQGKRCYRIFSTAKSNDMVSVFYRVRDSVETVVDYDGIFSRKFHKLLREGGYKADKTTIFDQRKHLAITGNDSIPTYAFVQDALSSMYYARTQELIPDNEILIDNHTDKKNFPLKIVVLRRETVEVPAGKFDCVVIEPIMRAEGIFKAKGRIWIWLTDDQYKMPVKMQTEVFFLGSVSAQLKTYTLGTLEGAVE